MEREKRNITFMTHGHMAPCSPYYILGSTCDTFVVYRQLQNLGSAV
jgi:hypothetical protein